MNDHTLLRHRRAFLGAAAAAAANLALPRSSPAQPASPAGKQEICVFEKFIQDLSFEQLADVVAELGFTGIEATVRKGGHIEPPRVADQLPRMVEALAQRDLNVTIMTTDVLDVDDPVNQLVLQTAADLGIKRYRMGFYTYDLEGDVLQQMNEFGAALREVAAANRQLGLTALYQNHSGAKFFGATLWDLYEQIKDVPPQEVASAFDIRHATIEAGLAWPLVYRVMRPHVGAMFVKDYQWQGNVAEHVPLGEGRVDPRLFRQILSDGLAGPISLHVEYLSKKGTQENIEGIRRDLKVLRGWLQG